MKRLSVVWLVFLVAGCAAYCPAQVAPSAHTSQVAIKAGGEGSMFQPDYQGNGCCAEASPQKLFGLGAYVDAEFTRWIQIEAQGRWLHWNQYAGVYQNTYMIGPRVPIREIHGFTPYGKYLIGWGSMSDLSGKATAMAFGGGVDYRLSHKLTLRAFDFEYQDWRVANPNLHPYGGSVGLSYRIF